MLGTWEIIVIVLVVLLLFGGKKIPELMHGVGKGVKSFKDGMNGVEDTERDRSGANGVEDTERDRSGANGVDEVKNEEEKTETK
jgi:sec-independent protein translocase protein TatA